MLARSYRALALAPLDPVRIVAVPVDELLHRCEAEISRQGQILDLFLESCGADTLGVGVELLAVAAIGLVHADPALHGLGGPLRGDSSLQARPEDDLAADVVAADVGDV